MIVLSKFEVCNFVQQTLLMSQFFFVIQKLIQFTEKVLSTIVGQRLWVKVVELDSTFFCVASQIENKLISNWS